MTSSRRDFLRQTTCALGATAFAAGVSRFGLINALAQGGAATDYKALVCVFLNGGNDGNNTVVPYDDYLSAGGYNAVRSAAQLAVPQSSLLQISPTSQGGRKFGLHPSLSPEVATPGAAKGLLELWNQQKVAVMCNVGPLVEPLTRDTYRSGTGRRPVQLFSHSDQVGIWQTSVADSVSQTGWGGRTADRIASLNGSATFPQILSVAGINVFSRGENTRPLGISDSRTPLSSVLPLSMSGSTSEVTSRRAAFDALRNSDLGALLVKASSDTTAQALQTSAALSSANSTLTTAFPDTTLGYQLEQIARVIKLRDTLAVKRQIFFCSLGGFDTHNNQGNQTGTQANLLAQVSQAMRAFYDATVELGIPNQVTTFTLSDFGRTFQPAGTGGAVGSDHGWGNHQLMMGGAVRGGDFYGAYPTLALSGPDDTDSRGRWIPTTSVEQYAATLATWYGLSASDLPIVFPFIGRFATSNLGFLM
ncbi:MAG TPA: DUF1501 domain-containing protein [Pyrinomonadaceae bacterium]|nr:DUF1501 domain-containing protein [Pyrinomonadaceae bacterium]